MWSNSPCSLMKDARIDIRSHDTNRIGQPTMTNADRIFQGEDQQWYFNVRGNQAVGPFPSRGDAGDALTAHVRVCQRRTDAISPWPRDWSPARLLRRSATTPRHT